MSGKRKRDTDSSLPPSLSERVDDEQDEDLGTELATPDHGLVRLHSALKRLDEALHDALRALEVSLGRSPNVGPPPAMTYREMGRLKLHVEAALRDEDESRPAVTELAVAEDSPDEA